MCVFYYCRTYYKAVRVGGEESGGHVLRETTSRGLCGLVCPSRTGTREEPGTLTQGAPVFPRSSRAGTREEPGTLTQGAPVFPRSSRLGIEPKTPGWLVQDPTTRPKGDLIPTIGGFGATGLVILQIFTALGSGLALSAIVPLAKARAGGRAADPSFSVTTLTRSFVAIHLLAASVAALFTLGGGGGGG
jgi:hypothetical protein